MTFLTLWIEIFHIHSTGLFLFTAAVSRPTLDPTQPPIQWVTGAFSVGKTTGERS